MVREINVLRSQLMLGPQPHEARLQRLLQGWQPMIQPTLRQVGHYVVPEHAVQRGEILAVNAEGVERSGVADPVEIYGARGRGGGRKHFREVEEGDGGSEGGVYCGVFWADTYGAGGGGGGF